MPSKAVMNEKTTPKYTTILADFLTMVTPLTIVVISLWKLLPLGSNGGRPSPLLVTVEIPVNALKEARREKKEAHCAMLLNVP